MNLFLLLMILIVSLLSPAVTTAQKERPDVGELRLWIQEMKQSSRGPFKRIRWFCKDGTIQPPVAYACRERGGGVQHGEWNDRVKVLRNLGYAIANVLADIQAEDFINHPAHEKILKQIILEQFLIKADDGWIFRRARFYRGALQSENEIAMGRDILLALLGESAWRNNRFLVLREAVRFLPHGRKGAPITEMRQIARSITEKDEGFERLRNKLHVKPDAKDADRVRTYAVKRGIPDLSGEYENLARVIERTYHPQDMEAEIVSLANRVKDPESARKLKNSASSLSDKNELPERLETAGHLLAWFRQRVAHGGNPKLALTFLDTSLLLEREVFRYSNALTERLPGTTRRERLSWLRSIIEAIYGMGLISSRQWRALGDSFHKLTETNPPLNVYLEELNYVSRASEWADRLVRFHFQEVVRHLSDIEPLTRLYIHDRLRGSPLLSYAAVLESLARDANRLAGIRHRFFGESLATGLRGLNPGLARGTLRFSRPGKRMEKLDSSAIYVLPTTNEDLPPIAGIITAGHGNSLSHVQLLARNLGIPNVAIAKRLISDLKAWEGRRVVLAVSPRGMVSLTEDSPKWDGIFEREAKPPDTLIRPDLDKLDLDKRDFIPLYELRASDSGRVAGPKAANLGELKNRFPEAVTDGLVIPFGVFRTLLDDPIEPGGPTAFSWMEAQYRVIQNLKDEPGKQNLITQQFLEKIHDWITTVDPGEDFRVRLRAAMDQVFGKDGTYGVFVRSDTNVEDLPGFTGAGLNLTVPNVVGFEKVLAAISRVWASPFRKRPYEWRQAHMENPEHLYVSVLLMKTVPAEKSGVMVTADLESGRGGWLSIAVNEGVGGATSGQEAEELRVNMTNGKVHLLAQATEPLKRVILPQGGLTKIAASGTDTALSKGDIDKLVGLARMIPERFPKFKDANGEPLPADIEFGFHNNALALFQIRPFLESSRARRSLFLGSLDRDIKHMSSILVDLDAAPPGEQP
ncbi:hypothetical protein N9174_00440 [bacterium]|nr:hypothetical protein [bacterium]